MHKHIKNRCWSPIRSRSVDGLRRPNPGSLDLHPSCLSSSADCRRHASCPHVTTRLSRRRLALRHCRLSRISTAAHPWPPPSTPKAPLLSGHHRQPAQSSQPCAAPGDQPRPLGRSTAWRYPPQSSPAPRPAAVRPPCAAAHALACAACLRCLCPLAVASRAAEATAPAPACQR